MSNAKLEFSRGDAIADKYEVVDLLDESPLGLTYRVKHLKTGKHVRLLLLRPAIAGREQKDQILEAFKKAKAAQHAHLVKVGELGEHQGIAYYTMEDFEAPTLRELLQQYRIENKQFAVSEAAQIVTQILEGLAAAHAQGVILRALRPEYVLVSIRHTGPRRQTFVAQTKLVGTGFFDLVPTASLTEDEFTRGEAQYIAPELKSFDPTPSARSDIYSAGVILYEMLVGTAPVGTFQLPRTKRPDLPEHINNIVEIALGQAPDDRYPSAQDFTHDIQRIFQDDMAEEEETRPMVTPIVWVLAALLVISVGVIAFNFRPDPIKEAEAADSQIRKAVIEAHMMPDSGEVASILEKHPKNMVYIPPGPFVFGRLHSEPLDLAHSSEPLAQQVELGAYLIDLFEFPNLANEAPKYNVTYTEAEQLCAEQGKRLCTEQEWEKACKGPRNFIYSYGDAFDPEACGRGLEDIYRSQQRESCRSGWQVFDLSGNFREWTATAPTGKDRRRIVKGGLKGNPQKGTRCAASTDAAINFKDASLSFRCCMDVKTD